MIGGFKLYKPLFYRQPLIKSFIPEEIGEELKKARLNNHEEKKLMSVLEDFVYILLGTDREDKRVRESLLNISLKRHGFTYIKLLPNDDNNLIKALFNLLASFNGGNREVLGTIINTIKINIIYGTYSFTK